MVVVHRTLTPAICAVFVLLAVVQASAQTYDATIFAGRAFPLYDERLTLRPSSPVLSGVDVTVVGSPLLEAEGGAVFGGAFAVEFGLLGIEGRLDATDVGLDFSGARYDLRGVVFPFEGLTASLIASPGRFDADRISILSLNGRVRTPGRIGVVASGGLSYLPDIDISGSIPLTVEAPDLLLTGLDAALTLRASPGQHRFGVNGGAGLRAGDRVALTAEIRAFYFPEYRLRLTRVSGPDLLDDLLAGAAPVRFEPVFVNAQVGVTFRF
jgi:hypothetical protein